MSLKSVVLDVETSGARAYNAYILEVGAVVLDEKREEVARFETLAHPGSAALRKADPAAIAVNGLTAELLADAPPLEEAAGKLRDFLVPFEGWLLHSFNNEFDYSFLARDPWKGRSFPWGECIMQAAMGLMGSALPKFPNGRTKYPSLEEAARFFGVKMEPGHRALPDAITAARVQTEIFCRRDEAAAGDEVQGYMR
jgi:DNA polymerase III epsilon subunit-like protein